MTPSAESQTFLHADFDHFLPINLYFSVGDDGGHSQHTKLFFSSLYAIAEDNWPL